MELKKLNLGCGRDYRKGFVNIDICNELKADVYHDLGKFPYPFKDDHFDEVLSLGTLELIDANFLKIMEELHRICKPGAIIKIRGPVFPNMCSAQDPLTKKFLTWNTFEYFKGEGGTDYYSKARFKTLKREYIFSINKFHWVNPIINLAPAFYTRFLFNLFPANCIYYKLKVLK
ncbi:hypothetical protein CMI37_26510 [Candidatus Pacearchaeota archaeon]|nr:hypothetical protein [Candidatus Pacearchaeota archaeon]|tara:strand:- start:6316 stop:6837 length:522 start_codon:yes stop_codon:yes gene_type:complete